MSILKRLFGGGDAPKPEAKAEVYNDFRIFPEPKKDAGGFRVAARIEKDVNGETLTHRLIRADTIQDYQTAVEASVSKSKQVIDEQGERLFG